MEGERKEHEFEKGGVMILNKRLSRIIKKEIKDNLHNKILIKPSGFFYNDDDVNRIAENILYNIRLRLKKR